MNYFELFGLPIGFQVDTQKLRAAFMDIQKATHPDKFAQGNPEEQEAALEKWKSSGAEARATAAGKAQTAQEKKVAEERALQVLQGLQASVGRSD